MLTGAAGQVHRASGSEPEDDGFGAQPRGSMTTAVDRWLAEQQLVTPVAKLADTPGMTTALVPRSLPGPGQQYRFEVDLDTCTGCKACVVACHTMNGLDEDESWRSVGLLHGENYQQTVTTGCHHCVDPGCLAGCPVDAYEKDPVTGIVIHLDDQCIGCRYCTLTCPYEVPQYNESRGIVRKCDLCHTRLAEGEAPACVSACPNGAISVSIVDTVELVATAAGGERLVPGAPPSALTVPSTRYRTERREIADAMAADADAVHPAHAHDPLAVMLVLTQLSVGAFLIDLLAPGTARTSSAMLAVATGLLALGASVFHLGRPMLAWRAVIGLGHSWLSREVVAFGAFAGLAVPYAMTRAPALGVTVAVAGATGVGCSVMVYAVTGRRWWRADRTAIRFTLTTAVCGLAAVAATTAEQPVLVALMATVAVKLAWELSVLRHRRRPSTDDLHRTARLLTGRLARPFRWRVLLGVVGGLALPALALVTDVAILTVPGLLLATTGELVERRLFFTAVSAPRMPGLF